MSKVNFVTTSVTNQADFRAELDLSQMTENVENLGSFAFNCMSP